MTGEPYLATQQPPKRSFENLADYMPETHLRYAGYALKSGDTILWIHRNTKNHMSGLAILAVSVWVIISLISLYYFLNSFSSDPVPVFGRYSDGRVSPAIGKLFNGAQFILYSALTLASYFLFLQKKDTVFIFTQSNVITIKPDGMANYIITHWDDIVKINHAYDVEAKTVEIVSKKGRNKQYAYLTDVESIPELADALPETVHQIIHEPRKKNPKNPLEW